MSKEPVSKFSPVVPFNDMDLTHVISPKAAFKLVQVVEFANLAYMFGGFDKILRKAGKTFEDICAGEVIMFINTRRDYIKLLVGNGTMSPVIAAYRFPNGIRLPSEATKEVVRSFLKRGEIQMDERLRLAVGETLSEMKRRVVGGKVVVTRPSKDVN